MAADKHLFEVGSITMDHKYSFDNNKLHIFHFATFALIPGKRFVFLLVFLFVPIFLTANKIIFIPEHQPTEYNSPPSPEITSTEVTSTNDFLIASRNSRSRARSISLDEILHHHVSPTYVHTLLATFRNSSLSLSNSIVQY